MQPIKPGVLLNNQLQHTSVAKVLDANVAIGQVATYDSTGTPDSFTQDNGSGIMIRVGDTSNPFALPNAWIGDNTDTTIIHNLGRVPIGYYVAKKTQSCDVYDGSILPTDSTITLCNTNGTGADTVIYIF
jgi:hypothetical protein